MKGYFSTFNIFRYPKSSAGFTLVELLVAMVITTILVSLAGSGLVSIMSANQKVAAETERRVNLNRALDFIADEIRMANSLSAGGTGATKTLHLTIPSDSTNPNRVYYIGSSDSNWVGPNTVFRAVGTYSTSASVSGGKMIVDAITDPASAPSCSGTLAGANGFYACIQNNRVVELYLYGKLTDAYNNQNGIYEAKTKVFARSAIPTPTPTPTPTSTPTSTPTPTPTPTPMCTVPNFNGVKANNAQGIWTNAGFNGTFTKNGNGNFTINSQSLPAGSKPCSSSITVSG